MKKLIIIIPLLAILTGCEWIRSHHTGDVVAQVGDKILYESDIRQLVPIGTSPEDSLRIVYQYIQQWATNQLLYKKAVQNSGQKNEIEAMVEDYRRLLYVHEYEQNLLQRHRSDTIPDDSILSYHKTHHDIFRLRDNLIKGMMIIIPKSSRDKHRLIEWMQNPTQDNQNAIESFAYEKSLGYSNFLEQWQSLNEIKLHIPLQTTNDTEWLRQNSFVTLEDSAKAYLLRITDKLFIGDEMPYEIAKPEIANILENGMQISTLRQIENELYKDGVRHGDIYLKETRTFEELLSLIPREQTIQVESPQIIDVSSKTQTPRQTPYDNTVVRPAPLPATAPTPTPQQQFQQQTSPAPAAEPIFPPQQQATGNQQQSQPQQQSQDQQEAVFDYDIFE